MGYIDMTGQRFGKLVVQVIAGRDKQGNVMWQCLCDCGRQVNVSGTNLRQGRKQSCGKCGSTRAIDITGQRFGRLVVIERVLRHSANGNACWCCRCDCGNEVVVDVQRLRTGVTRSCGCLRQELVRKRALTNEAFRKTQGNVDALKNSSGVFLCSIKRTRRNHTGIVGVSFDKQSGRYVARLRYQGQYVLNETTRTLQEAATLRHRAELKYFHQQVEDDK